MAKEKMKNSWSKVRIRDGKLVGMLTDNLANHSFHFTDGLSGTGTSGGKAVINTTRISTSKINKKFPSKFK